MSEILPTTIEAQRIASDPARSVFVAANAGSGKTHVLTERVVRLLLAGAEPAKILCLTYTKAAAAEMQTRVFARLSHWAVTDEATLRQAIEDLDKRAPSRERLAEARRLFARALEAPGGLKIQTIHAFCEAVLHQFPLEANIPGHFEVLDDAESALLLAEARRMLISGARTSPDDPGGQDAEDAAIARAFADALSMAGEWGLDALLGEIVQRRDRLRRHLEATGGRDAAEERLRRALGLQPGETEASALSAAIDPPGFEEDFREALAEAAQRSGKATDAKLAAKIALVESAATPEARFTALCAVVFKADGGRYKASSVATKAVSGLFADFEERLETLAEFLEERRERLATLRLARASGAALTIAEKLEADYAALKRRRGRLDFEDLIVRTADLLLRADASAWVHFKLDQGIDHVLVDEAQDTSPRQWQVVRQLVEEFFAGASASVRPRTVFAVGDEKQSIYSFQGASPEMFDAERRYLRSLAEGGDRPFAAVELHQSFRSVPEILKAVDQVFADPADRRGLQSDEGPPVHVSTRTADPGLIEVWPVVVPATVPQHEDWLTPVDLQPETSPAHRLAGRIAAQIKNWIGRPIRAKGKLRPLDAGDVLILVRKRSGFVAAMGAALRAAGIPAAGADRLVITDHIAVADLVALGRTVSNAEDELSLAAALKSPLFGFSDDELMALALSRKGARQPEALYFALRRLARPGGAERVPPFVTGAARERLRDKAAHAFDRLEELRRRAGFETVFTFFARILGPEEGRARLVARLGRDAGDVVDAFLDLALAEEQAGRGGLEAFLADLAASPPEIKREMEHGRGEVRIMTTHASKGLEAPVVFLVDPGSAPFSHSHGAKLMEWSDMPARPPGMPPGFLWCPDLSARDAAVAALREAERARAEDEYRRLLYVGLTRAADRLVVCGLSGVRGPDEASWLQKVEAALKPHAREIKDTGTGETLAWRLGSELEGATLPPVAAPDAPVFRALDLSKLAPEDLPPRPLQPSTASGGSRIEVAAMDDEGALSASPVLGAAGRPATGVRRGLLLHRLLQALPDLAPEAREAAAHDFARREGRALGEEEATRIAGQALAILDEPAYAPFFGPGNRAEVAVAGEIELAGRRYAVSGAIDRLAVTADAVHILDYKTNRPFPESLAAVPAAHLLQLALYAEMVRPLFEGRRIRAALLYSEGPRLIEVTEQAMAEALAERAARSAAGGAAA
ncbi:double-strand break repair helicase AddA [Aureimonas sp. Leaf324]|uniref:double-strand break repair helicase AddA n=1 Tax=Aureimonas sp. Leaf324 TaxID=1736336 RepID=UPI0006FFA893|nr:double-strand break repair helicase AddA [Aureimonas sp. Leaf324]KQQ78924.1 DNA helicase [Aureimonas sp. Leaf324]